MIEPAVRVRDLVKRYPKQKANAVDGLSFEVAPAEIFGLLGPNGAGKTTTVGVLTTRVRATSGEARVAGIDVRRDPVGARGRLAVVPQQVNLDRSLTPRQNLVFHAAYHAIGRAERQARAAELLDQFGLADRADDKVDWYSGGMAQRLMIARALMHEPEVLFLDEPTTGLDPQSRLFLWDRVREMRDRGVTIVMTTHDMDEAAALSDRVGIVDHGKLLALDTPDELVRGLKGQSVIELTVAGGNGSGLDVTVSTIDGVDRVEPVATGPAFPGAAPSLTGAASRFPRGTPRLPGDSQNGTSRLRLYVSAEPSALLAPVATAVAARGAVLSDIHIGKPSLEDVFIHLTGRGLR